MNSKYLFLVILSFLLACSPKVSVVDNNMEESVPEYDLIDFTKGASPEFRYFANGHLAKENYPFKILEKDGRRTGEIVRASDARLFTGMYLVLNKPIRIADGKRFSMDVWMDHLGSFNLKLEESTDGGPTTSLTVKNTKINEWETLYFDFKDAVFGGPTYPKIAIFSDIYQTVTGKDVYSYFSNIKQHGTKSDEPITGDKNKAVKIVVLGSSTAAGTGPSESRNAWVNRYRRQLQAENGHNQVVNLAVGGYTTYHLLPSDTPTLANRPKPDVRQNVTMALSLNPDAVLINLPSNDTYKGFSLAEQLENYRKICKPLNDKGVPVWVSTPQGRKMEKPKRMIHKELIDSTYEVFGRKTLDFYRDLAHWSGTPSPKYDCGDGVHLNDEGHRLLFEEVLKKEIVAKIIEQRNGIEKKDFAYSRSLYREGHALIWQEEFDGNKLDMNVWSHELADGCPDLCGWGNAEKVWYRPENTMVKDGKLIITAKPDHEQDGFWSSSRLVTRGKKSFKYGRIDIRAKLPVTRGLWPALWLLGDNRATDDWPYCGEIDMMEQKGQIPWRVRGTVFYKGTDGGTYHEGGKTELQYGNYSDDFHLFSIDWTKNSIKYYVDDVLFAERKFSDLKNFNHEDNPFTKPFYMLLNLAVGGNYLGYPDESSVFPQTLEVDYIRHYIADKYYYVPKKEDKVKVLPPKNKLWIFLLAGQSNMEGAGTVGPQDTITHPRILTMSKEGEWLYAKEPIHKHSNGNKGLDNGLSFARTLLKSVPDDVSIAIIPTAMGGSALNNWIIDDEYRGMHLWSNMKSKIRATEKDGVFKGMLWHQGESDAKPDRIPVYDKKFHQFLENVRKEVKNPDMPAVLGEVGKFQTHRPLWIQFNKEITRMANVDPLLKVIKTDDLSDKGDQVHFDAEGQRIMGIRYARKMAKLLNLPEPKVKNTHKIMTYNIRLDVVSDGKNAWKFRKDAMINQINEIRPDVFGIQEGLSHQVKYLKYNLKNYDYVGQARDGKKDNEEYSAVFYNVNKYNILYDNTIWLSETPNKVSKGWDAAHKRIATYAQIEDKKSGKKFWVFNTHLDHKGTKARAEGIKVILNEIDKVNDKHETVILMGDLNESSDNPLINSLNDRFIDGSTKLVTSNYEPIGTFNSFDPKSTMSRRIDYIFTSKNVLIESYMVNRTPSNGRFVSDHFPVIVDMEF